MQSHTTDGADAQDSPMNNSVEKFKSVLDSIIDESIIELTETERGSLIDSLVDAHRDTINDFEANADGVLYHDDDWYVITSDRHILQQYVDDPDEKNCEFYDLDAKLATNLLQSVHDRVAEEISGNPHIASDVDVFVYKRE
ncbi:hypothetical protein [Halopiger aswanensis]|uniref:Uncharacterized protein n=1 Tax=Halopiger aswanensis TaxID=148449 RepID=A0A419WQS5_9EURY|nr:hypothetical protein [Halopiger aswanensis]RKD97830.1 hypothetical protein ATJ93_0824 [Halopiger aswanensis]